MTTPPFSAAGNAAPEVSVVMPAFNAARFLAQAIDSVLAQVDADLELIVVDDGSTDDTPSVLAGYGDRVRLLRQPNGGLAGARNAGAALARGRWIALMDADDLCAPDRIALQLQALREHPDAVLCCSDFSAFDGQGTALPSHEARYYSMIAEAPGGLDTLFGPAGSMARGADVVAVRCAAVHDQIVFGNFVHPPTAMVSRAAHEALGGFDRALRYNSDWEFFTRLARLGPFIHIDRPLLDYRLSASQMSSPANNRGAAAEDLVAAASKVWAADPTLARRFPGRMAAKRREFLADAANGLSAHRSGVALKRLAQAAAAGLPAREVVRTAARILVPRRAVEAARRWRDPLSALVGSVSEHDGLQVRLEPLPPLADLEADWAALEQRSTGSFFISWTWIGRWLAHLPREVPRLLVRVQTQGRLVGLAVVCGRDQRRLGLVGRSRGLYLNCAGDPHLDELTIEYNAVLAEAGLEQAALRAVAAHFAGRPGWDELFLDGWDPADVPAADILARHRLRLVDRAVRPCTRVDLKALRESGRAYAESLPQKVAYKLRRSQRCAEEMGEVALDVAADPQEAQRYLSELMVLHQQSWTRRGHPGSFANAFFSVVHADLVGRHENAGRVQLVRMRVDGRAVGYLYNFVHRGRVYNYQSGFDFEAGQGGAWRPGLICHARAIEMNLAQGMDVYDFMAGEHAYKKELGVDAGTMSWLTLQRPRLKFRIEAALKAWRTRLQARRPVREDSPDAASAPRSNGAAA